jgi:hypothetical protein
MSTLIRFSGLGRADRADVADAIDVADAAVRILSRCRPDVERGDDGSTTK